MTTTPDTDGPEYRITIDIPKGGSKGVRYQAHAETTVTGVRWVITGDLAKALMMRGILEVQRDQTEKEVSK